MEAWRKKLGECLDRYGPGEVSRRLGVPPASLRNYAQGKPLKNKMRALELERKVASLEGEETPGVPSPGSQYRELKGMMGEVLDLLRGPARPSITEPQELSKRASRSRGQGRQPGGLRRG